MNLAQESGGGAAAVCVAAMPCSLRGDAAMPLILRGEPSFADMEALHAVGAAVDVLAKHLSISSRSLTN